VKRYSPELQKRSAEQGNSKEQEFDDYVKKLKEWSKSDKSSTSVERTVLWPALWGNMLMWLSSLVWFAAKEEQDAKQAQIDAQRRRAKEETRVQREEMRKEMLGEKWWWWGLQVVT
jgi:hypothetical protein